MSNSNREFRPDAEGVDRLVAGPADKAPPKSTAVPAPARVEMAPQHYDDEKGEFTPDPDDA